MQLASGPVARQEISLAPLPGTDIFHLIAVAPEVHEHQIFQQGAEVRGIAEGHGAQQSGIHRVDFRRVQHPGLFRPAVNGHRVQQVGVEQVVKIVIETVFGTLDGQALQGVVKPVDTELAARGMHDVTNHLFECQDIADPVPFDYVPEQHRIDIPLQNFHPPAGLKLQYLREAADLEILGQCLAQDSRGPCTELARRLGNDSSGIEKFTEAERKNLGRKGAAAQTGGDFRAQQLGGRAGEINPDLFRIEQTPDEQFPLADALDLVKEKEAFDILAFREAREKDIQKRLKILHPEIKQSVILEIEVHNLLLPRAGRQEFPHFLVAEKGLASAPHADGDIDLAGKLRKGHFPGDQLGQVPLLEIVDDLGKYGLHKEILYLYQ